MKFSEHVFYLTIGQLRNGRHGFAHLLDLFGTHVSHDLGGRLFADAQKKNSSALSTA